jgi:hypothetical protein
VPFHPLWKSRAPPSSLRLRVFRCRPKVHFTGQRLSPLACDHGACRIVSAYHTPASARLHERILRTDDGRTTPPDARMQQRIASFVSSACFHRLWQLNISLTCRECGTGEGHMDDIIGRVVASTGADRTVAERAVGVIRQFLREAIPAQGGAEAARLHPMLANHARRDRRPDRRRHPFDGNGAGRGTDPGGHPRTMSFAHEKAGKAQSARSSARFPASAGSFDAW